jgi:hypothetical protein
LAPLPESHVTWSIGFLRVLMSRRSETIAAVSVPAELDGELAQLRDLVERSDVEAARQLVQDLKVRWPDSSRVDRWMRVLQPPLASVVNDTRVRDLSQEHEWLRENARKHPGCWLAVLGCDLLAANPDLRNVLEVTRRAPGGDRALLHFEPKDPDRK